MPSSLLFSCLAACGGVSFDQGALGESCDLVADSGKLIYNHFVFAINNVKFAEYDWRIQNNNTLRKHAVRGAVPEGAEEADEGGVISMATSKEYADFIRAKFSRLDVVTIKPMMGEYVIHMAGKVLGFIGDEQLMFEPGPTIDRLLPDAEKRELFPGSKLFPIIPDGMSEAQLCGIAEAIYDDLPISKPRKPRKLKSSPASKAAGDATDTAAEEKFPFAKFIKW